MGEDLLPQKKLVTFSKFLSYVLRHHPESIGLALDTHGWAEVKKLLHYAAQHGNTLTFSELEEIVARNNKNRFELSMDRTRIRARQGHSIPVDVELSPVKPPELLYHGTATRFISSIKEKGLLKKGRLYVHLSINEETAHKVGKRHGKPVIITIHAHKMYQKGYKFFLSSNGVWLTEYVPPGFIEFKQ